MKTFTQFLEEIASDLKTPQNSGKFKTMDDIEAYIYDKASPETYDDTMAFINKIDIIPDFIKGVKLYKGKYDTVLFNLGQYTYSIDVDYPREVLNINIVTDQDTPNIKYKAYPFQDLVSSTPTPVSDIN